MTRIEKVKQKAILDVAESLGYSLNDYQGKSMNIQNTILLGFFADTNTFKWFSRDIQGDVIDFVQLVIGVFF
ncbi:Uncharacterised protein [Streptococcus agalactiae]|nr:Uncharacterised protein [Streptococcus agalactiae]